MPTYIDLNHSVQVAEQPTARLNPHAAKRGEPFVTVDLGDIIVTLDDPAHARRIAQAFLEAADLQAAALGEPAGTSEHLAAAEASPANPYGGQAKHGEFTATSAAEVAEGVETDGAR